MTALVPPATLTINADIGDGSEVGGIIGPALDGWGVRGRSLDQVAALAPPAGPNRQDWTDPRVGWGIVLPMPDKPTVTDDDLARGVDAPEPIRELLQDRPDAPVLRYDPQIGFDKLARFDGPNGRHDPHVGLSDPGVAPGHLPTYLLIVGSPTEVPWAMQYSLNRSHQVGRLDLSDDGLANYVSALRAEWAPPNASSDPADPTRPVVWSVEHDSMTAKMDATLAAPIRRAMSADTELDGAVNLIGPQATADALIEALAQHRPAVIVTSSHGRTGPLGQPDEMRATLGLPVDNNRDALSIDDLLARWEPAGAVWFAQACCSAGSDERTSYAGLLTAGSLADQVLTAVSSLGSTTAPLPTALLGAAQPVRAFIGQIEPTFDWTLIERQTGQFLTPSLVEAVYPRLFLRQPAGLAFDDYYRGVGELYAQLADAIHRVNQLQTGAGTDATYLRLTAADRESLVLLGDPTVRIPPLPSQRET